MKISRLTFLFVSVCLTCCTAFASPSITFTSPPTWRDPILWPFANWSIWNLPIGRNAVYVPVKLAPAGTQGIVIEADPDVLVMHATHLPARPFYYSSAGWAGGKNRCLADGQPLFNAPWPSDFVIPHSRSNYATAILLADNTTIRQGQPVAMCKPGGNLTMLVGPYDMNIYGGGRYGAHGGSGFSSIGGTLRLGEMMPIANGSTVVRPARHALKGNLFGRENFWRGNSSTCFRWPAFHCDAGFYTGYNGTDPNVRMGALLALNSSVDITKLGLQTGPGLALAWTLQNYGVYLADDSGWPAYSLETELSPEGNYEKQFEAAWGFPFWGGPKSPWGSDVQKIYNNLNVVDNWNAALFETVKASNGLLGVGGGAPRQSWAPIMGA